MFWKYLAFDTINKTWIIPLKAFEIFGWTFLDGFDALKLCFQMLPANAAKVGGSHFGKKPVHCGITLQGQKHFLKFKTTVSE